MIPISLFGINTQDCDIFFGELPHLMENIDDNEYESMLYKIDTNLSLKQIHEIDEWAGFQQIEWPDDVVQEVLTNLDLNKYPDVSLGEGIMTIDGIDAVRISYWLHFLTLVYPIYNENTCAGLRRLGLKCTFEPNNLTSYGVYVNFIEGLKEYAPAGALPELSFPRQRLLEIGLANWQKE